MRKMLAPVVCIVVPVACLVLLALPLVPVVVNRINEAPLTNRFFAMGKYYKVHNRQMATFVVNEIRAEKDPNERAFWIGALEKPNDAAAKRETEFLFNLLISTRDVEERNR